MKTSRDLMIEQAVAEYIEEMDYDNALPREVGIDKEGNYYFYLSGIINEDPNGNWDYDDYATEDMPYYKLPLNNNGEYDEVQKVCEITPNQGGLLLNDMRYLFGSGGVEDLIEKQMPCGAEFEFDAERQRVSRKFLNMVIEQREPIGMFYTQVENGNYVGVDNLEGEAWTEEFVHFKTLERWMSDGSFSYFSETDMEKYALLDADTDKYAVGVGNVFNIVDKSLVEHIDLKESGVSVEKDGVKYNVLKATTFEESQKVDSLLDMLGEYPVSDYKVDRFKKGRDIGL